MSRFKLHMRRRGLRCAAAARARQPLLDRTAALLEQLRELSAEEQRQSHNRHPRLRGVVEEVQHFYSDLQLAQRRDTSIAQRTELDK